jgi:copper transport protein
MAAAAAALLLAAAPALSGHAAAAEARPGLLMTADALHVLGAGAWIGSLAVLAMAALPVALAQPSGQRAPAAVAAVGAFSPVALLGAVALALTGLFAGFAHVPSLAALTGTAYGRLLVIKLGLVAAVVALGGWHWLSVKPALGSEQVAGRLRRTTLAELALALAALAVTALLATTAPPAGA